MSPCNRLFWIFIRKFLDLTGGSDHSKLTWLLWTNIAPASNSKHPACQSSKHQFSGATRAIYKGYTQSSCKVPSRERWHIPPIPTLEKEKSSTQKCLFWVFPGGQSLCCFAQKKEDTSWTTSTRKLHENGWLRMIYNNEVQGGPLTVINGVITPLNGLVNDYLAFKPPKW